MKSSFREALARPAATPERGRARSTSRTVRLLLKKDGDMPRPVDVARMLNKAGLSLRKAHATLNRLAQGEEVALELEAGKSFIGQLAGTGVSALPIRQAPAQDVYEIRAAFGLSQAEFATRFGIALDTLQNWEQGRNRPEPAMHLLLTIIKEHPEIVEAILTRHDA